MLLPGTHYPTSIKYLITAPRDMRDQLVRLIQLEAENAKHGLPSGICIKVNSLEDKLVIDELYKASAGRGTHPSLLSEYLLPAPTASRFK